MSAYTPPATFTASACHIAHTDDEPTNHFTADCPAVSANGAACTLALTSGYEVSTPLHAEHHRRTVLSTLFATSRCGSTDTDPLIVLSTLVPSRHLALWPHRAPTH